MQGFCDGIQILKLYNKLTSRLIAASGNGTANNNKAADRLSGDAQPAHGDALMRPFN